MSRRRCRRNPLDRSLIYRGFRGELERKYGAERAAAIWHYAGRTLQRLEQRFPQEDDQHKAMVFPAVSLYRAIEHYAPGEALELTRGYGTRVGMKLRAVLAAVSAVPGVLELLWHYMPLIARKMSDGYQTANVVVNPHLCALDITGCLLYDCAKRLGTPQAVQMICAMDKHYMTGIRGVHYSRTRSIAEGDDCCDYRLTDTRKSGRR